MVRSLFSGEGVTSLEEHQAQLNVGKPNKMANQVKNFTQNAEIPIFLLDSVPKIQAIRCSSSRQKIRQSFSRQPRQLHGKGLEVWNWNLPNKMVQSTIRATHTLRAPVIFLIPTLWTACQRHCSLHSSLISAMNPRYTEKHLRERQHKKQERFFNCH